MKTIFGTKYQMIQARYKEHTYKADRRPYVQMIVERYQADRYDRKYFMVGLAIGLLPYIAHQWPIFIRMIYQ
jgi:hypothetical protein|tara:strand:+ start:837 stop:1052 length:216 start_codon:yes stop_codon:yes gene_type:complete